MVDIECIPSVLGKVCVLGCIVAIAMWWGRFVQAHCRWHCDERENVNHGGEFTQSNSFNRAGTAFSKHIGVSLYPPAVLGENLCCLDSLLSHIEKISV